MSLFYAPKPRRFEYRPRFYDERKERLEQMKARAKAENSRMSYSGLQKGFLTENRKKPGMLKNASAMRALRLFLIICVLLMIFFYWLPHLLK